jgi:large subunit ribosomal protein L10
MKAEKQIIIDEILERINASPYVIVADYTGMTVPQFETLRTRLDELSAEFHISKNTFVKRAAKDAELPEDLNEALSGQTGLVTGAEDVCAAAKVVKEFKKETGKLEIKGGALDGAYLDAAQVDALASLPPREVLLATLLGVLQAPASKLVRTLNEPGASLARVLAAKEGQG